MRESVALTVEPTEMADQHLFDELLLVAEPLGVGVRVEPFETPRRPVEGRASFRARGSS
jgi:hypothetical protein